MAISLSDSTLITNVRRLINEPVALIHSDADITAWLDMGAQTIAQTSLCWEDASASDQLGTGVGRYALTDVIGDPHTSFRIDAVIYLGDVANANICSSETQVLLHVPPRLFGHLSGGDSTGVPKYWTQYDEYLHVWPTPTASENEDYIRIFYRKMYADLSGDDDTTSLPDYLQGYTIWYAVAKAFEREGKYAQAQQYYSYFYSFISFHKQDRVYKPADSQDMMKLPDYTQFVE